MSCAIQIFGTVIQPVFGSTSASTTQAEYEYAGDGPTPAPLKRPGARGGLYDPTAPSVPNFSSANPAASAKVKRLSAKDTVPLANTSLSGVTSSCSAAASAIMSFSFCAAWMVALPIITVTRLE